MNATENPTKVRFTTKGQVVIPARLRREFEIQAGTEAIAEATPEGILLRPVTRRAINRLFGRLKPKPGEKPFAEWWAEHKAEELALEEAKYVRCTGGSR